MSAYSVPDNQIHVMVSYIVKNTHSADFYIPPFNSIHVGQIHDPDMENIQRIWDTLRAANNESLDSRYGETDDEQPVPFICAADLPEPLAMIKIVQNFEYQACEFEDWYTSKAKAICDGIVSLAIGKLMAEHETGHDGLPWGYDGDIKPDPYFCAPKLSDVDKPESGKIYRLI